MGIGSPRPEAKAVAYAETSLEVHRVYERATEALENLNSHRADSNLFAHNKRVLQEGLADREMQLVADERAANPDMSQAAFDRHIKTVFQSDADLRKLRSDLIEKQYQHDEAERMVAVNENEIRILTARMIELGGLLEFYAATKKSAVS